MSGSVFARRQLEKQGWKEGEGLGKKRDGISKPIKVSLKMDKTGVGHDPGSDFTDHWWLRVFNEAANAVTKTPQDAKPKEEETPRQKAYKGFVKASVLSNGKEEKDSDCCSSDDDDDEENDYSQCSSLPTLDDIHKFCGGATGHRAATLGIKMSGKVRRAAEQERLFNEKRLNKDSGVTRSDTENTYSEGSSESVKKSKDKISEELGTEEESSGTKLAPDSKEFNENDSIQSSESIKKRKKRSKKSEVTTEEVSSIHLEDESSKSRLALDSKEDSEVDSVETSESVKKRKKKKKKSEVTTEATSIQCEDESLKSGSASNNFEEVNENNSGESSESMKKRKKKRKRCELADQSEATTEEALQCQDESSKTKSAPDEEDNENNADESSESVKKRKKKRKKSEHADQTDVSTETSQSREFGKDESSKSRLAAGFKDEDSKTHRLEAVDVNTEEDESCDKRRKEKKKKLKEKEQQRNIEEGLSVELQQPMA